VCQKLLPTIGLLVKAKLKSKQLLVEVIKEREARLLVVRKWMVL
jgi:hypothetical protein